MGRGVEVTMMVRSSRLIKFTETLLKQVSHLPEYSSKFSRRDFTVRQHVVMLCLKIKTKQRYREFCDLLSTMHVICDILDLKKVPHWTTLDKVFLRLKNSVLMILLRTESSSYACIDATSFDIRHASLRYQLKCKIQLKSIKTTFLIDHDQCIFDMHCTTTRKHDSKIILPLTKKHRLKVLCADMGYDYKNIRLALKERGVRPLIPYRAYKQKHIYWNSLMDKKLYHKRSLVETVNSCIKRKYSDTIYSKFWRNQFKEITLLAIVYNIDRKIRFLLEVFYRAS